MPRKTRLILKTYSIIDEAVQSGIEYGYNRAHKHTDTPTAEAIKEEIRRAVMIELDDVVNWDPKQ